jgi:hypothetical protein
VLFKALKSGAQAEGPLQHLKVKLGGAFAGYVVVLLLLIVFVKPIVTAPHQHTWRVSGVVRLSPDKPEEYARIKTMVKPPDCQVRSDGTFEFEMPMQEDATGDPRLPTLVIEHPEYITANVKFLRGGERTPIGLRQYEQAYDHDNKAIVIREPIILQSLGDVPKYLGQPE